MSDLNALVGLDFSLFKTKLHAAYEKKGSKGYDILLMPSEQVTNEEVNLTEVIDDISKMLGNKNSGKDNNIENDLKNSISALNIDEEKIPEISFKLQMAYLYISNDGTTSKDGTISKDGTTSNNRTISKNETTSNVEYAFQLEITTKNLIPQELQDIVDVEKLSISVWNTDRQKVVEKMKLVTINEYLGKEEKSTLSDSKNSN